MTQIQTAYPISRFYGRYDIEMNNCGFYRSISQEVRVARPNGRGDHQFIFVVRGRVLATIDRQACTAYSGQMLYLPSDTPHTYRYEATAESLYYWVHFCGKRVEETVNLLSLKSGSYPLRQLTHYTDLIEQMLREIRHETLGCEQINNARMQQMLIMIGQELATAPTEGRPLHYANLQKIISKIRQEPERQIPTAQYAAACSLSEYYFIRLFKEITGLPPHRYRMRALMEKAKALLLDTDLYIEEIAALLQMEDPLYFSRCFKKETGLSPREFRKKMR